MPTEYFEPKMISLNAGMPELFGRSPHKFWVMEIHIKDLDEFRRSPREFLMSYEGFRDVDTKTGIRVTGIDGDKGNLPTSYIKKTHVFILDFRPLGIEAIHWACTADWYKKN